MSAIEALRLRQEAVLPAACLLKLGPLQKTAGPGRNFPGELGQSQGSGAPRVQGRREVRIDSYRPDEGEAPAVARPPGCVSLQVHRHRGGNSTHHQLRTRAQSPLSEQGSLRPAARRFRTRRLEQKMSQSGLHSMACPTSHRFPVAVYLHRFVDELATDSPSADCRSPPVSQHTVKNGTSGYVSGIARGNTQPDEVPRVVGGRRLFRRPSSGRASSRGHEAYE